MSHGHSNARSFGHDHGSTHPKRTDQLIKRATCDLAGGGLYTSPTKSTTITTLSPFTVTWDNTCLTDNPSSIDIYLYSADKGLIHAWTTVSYSAGSYTDSLQAAWWNNTQSTSLQISIVDTNTPRFLTSSPAGPLFKVDLSAAVYSSVTAAATSKAAATVVSTSTGTGGGIVITTQTASASSDGDSSSIFQTVGLVNKSGGITKGGLAAAIIVPILVIGVAVAIYVRFARLREAEKRKRWSEHIDKRMSTLSQDWRAGALPGEKRGSVFSTGGGGAAGGRTSFAGSEKRNTRASSFMGGASLAQARTNSTYGVENNMAGAGAMGNRIPRIPVASFHEKGDGSPEMRQIGQGARGSILNNNISTISLPEGAFHGDRSARVSFVEGGQPRMSRVSFGDSLNVRPNMGHATKPSVGSALRDNNASPERPSVDSFEAISPSQTQGPFSVGETDITNFGTSAANKVGKKSAAASMIGALTGANKREEKERAQLERQRTKEEAVQDWKQAEATRRSNDGLRDMEATLLRRSRALSQYSVNSPSGSPNPAGTPQTNTHSVYDAANDDSVEELRVPETAREGPGGVNRAASPMGMALPAAGLNPDELLAAYAAARARGNVGQAIETATSPISAPTSATLRPMSTASAGDRNPFRASMVESDYSVYADGNQNSPTGDHTGVAK